MVMREKTGEHGERTLVLCCPSATCETSGLSRLAQPPMQIRLSPTARRLLPSRAAATRARRRLRRSARASVSAQIRRREFEQEHSEPSVTSPAKALHRGIIATTRQVRLMDHMFNVFIGGYQLVDESTPQNMPGPSSMRRRHQWTKLQDKKLVEILLHNLHTRTIEVNKIKDVVYQVIAQEMSHIFSVSITPQNVKNRVQSLRKKYELYRILNNKTGMGWIHDENRLDGPPEVWTTLIQQNKKFKSLQKPQHLSYDDLHELFGGNRATGAYMDTFEVPPQSEPPHEQDDESEDDISLETLPTQMPDIRSSSQSNKRRSSGAPIGDSSGNIENEQRGQSSVRKRRQSQVLRLRAEMEDVLMQPAEVTEKKEWTQDYCSIFSLLRSMSISGRLLGQAMCYFDKHPHAAMQFVRADEEGRRDYLDYILSST